MADLDLESLDKPELRELALEHGIHVDLRRSLADIRAAIAEGLAEASAASPPVEDPIDVEFAEDELDVEAVPEVDDVEAAELDVEPESEQVAAPDPIRIPPRVRYARVLRRSSVAADGYVYTLPEGTVISTVTHDIEALIRQGVPVEEVDAPPPPRSVIQ